MKCLLKLRDHSIDVRNIEQIFFLLVKRAIKCGFNIDNILETPNAIGETCFSLAADRSEKISKFIIARNIRINSIDAKMMTPHFKYACLSFRMIEKNVNPYVIAYDDNNMLDRYPQNFSDQTRSSFDKFSRSIHYSVENINCSEKCPPDCQSNFRKFFYKKGLLVDMDNDQSLGEGGFGMVFEKSFLGEKVAMKCVDIGDVEVPSNYDEAKAELEKSIIEYLFPLQSSGSGIIIPSAIIRQQEQNEEKNGQRWTARNYNIFVYPKYDCNLFQLHQGYYDRFTNEILKDILDQCLIRKSSKT